MTPVPDCTICRRQVCEDYRRCRGELAALCARLFTTPPPHRLTGYERRTRSEVSTW